MKIRPLGAELSHADDRRTDMMKLIVAFRNFANAPKIKLQGVGGGGPWTGLIWLRVGTVGGVLQIR